MHSLLTLNSAPSDRRWASCARLKVRCVRVLELSLGGKRHWGGEVAQCAATWTHGGWDEVCNCVRQIDVSWTRGGRLLCWWDARASAWWVGVCGRATTVKRSLSSGGSVARSLGIPCKRARRRRSNVYDRLVLSIDIASLSRGLYLVM